MKVSLTTHFARRRPWGVVVALCWLILAPICQAQCLHAPDSKTGAVLAAAAADDCHGVAKAAASRTTTECECPYEPTHAGADRVEAPPPVVAELRLLPTHPLTPAVRATARHDPAIHGQGPPLRLLTLRFIE